MKKTKFIHVTSDGNVATRTSARAYTHVVVRRHQPDVAATGVAPVNEAQEVSRATEHWNECLLVQKAGIGGRVPYTRGQGGYGRPEGMEVRQGWYDLHCEYLKAYGTLDAYISGRLARAHHYRSKEVSNRFSLSAERFVYSWHHSAALALKACNGYKGYRGDIFYVQIINGGIRDDGAVVAPPC